MTDFSFQNVTVIGAGAMGAGIAQVAATAGSHVRLVDIDKDRAEQGRDRIDLSLARLTKKGKLEEGRQDDILSRIRASDDLDNSVSNADVVVEAVLEDMDLKRDMFSTISFRAPSHALLGTNTSSLSIGKIAAGNAAAGRIIGLHFFNPVPIMKLLEIVRGPECSDESVAAAQAFSDYLGKESILVRDVPGFATSRLGVLLGLEGIRMVEDGVASPEDIDKAMELGYRHPMGPLKLTDLVGLDVRLAIAEHLRRELDAPQFEPPQLMRDMVAQGKLGRKSGQGFYSYDAS